MQIQKLWHSLRDGTFVSRLEKKAFRVSKSLVKRRYSRFLFKSLKATVVGGPFEGMRLGDESFWSNDLVAMLLGTYEEELAFLFSKEALAPHDAFIDVGSADGYFAVGVAFCSALPVVAFEISDRSRAISRRNARLNGLEQQIEFKSEATEDELSAIVARYNNPLVLIDIEGAELEMLSANACAGLAKATVIVENHNVAKTKTGAEVASRMAASHRADVVLKTGRDPFRFRSLAAVPEDFAYLLLSEERGPDVYWVVLRPRQHRRPASDLSTMPECQEAVK